MLSTKSARDACKQGLGLNLLSFPGLILAVGITMVVFASPAIDITDTDMVLPQMINTILPRGIKGFVPAGFLAAFMSAFSISINNRTSYLIRDIHTRHVRPRAGRREFLITTHVSSVLFVTVGILLGMTMCCALVLGVWVFQILGGSMLVPLVLGWYWWRFNGWGFAFGMLAAFAMAVLQKVIQVNFGYLWPDYAFFFP